MEPTTEQLLLEMGWVHRLARALVRDDDEAADVVQETWLIAAAERPDTNRPLRPWLARVVRNLVRTRRRGELRRDLRETEYDQLASNEIATPAALAERVELQRIVAGEVLALDEPYRSTILLHFVEGVPSVEIAQRLGIPDSTVRRRLKTALDRLRVQLKSREERLGREWLAALVPLAQSAPRFVPPLTTPRIPGSWRRLVMAKVTSKTFALALIVLALLVTGAVMFMHHRERGASARPSGPQALQPAPSAQIVERPTMFAQPGVARRHVRGHVIADGAPFRGARVQLAHEQTSVVIGEVISAADGTFDLGERNADRYVVTASTEDRIAAPVTIDLRAPALAELDLVLTGCSHVRGTVVDGSGAPIAHARVARDRASTPFAETDVNGSYDLCTHFGGTVLRFSASGYQQVLSMVDAAPVSTRNIVLVPEGTVEGRVLMADDTPVEGAWVVSEPGFGGPTSNAPISAFTAADGSFRLVGVSPGRNLLTASASARRTPRPQELVVGAGQAITGIVLRLDATATLRGVVESGGVPVPGVGVGIRRGNRDELGVAAVTQPDGSFVIDRAPRGDLAVYVVDHVVVSPRSVRVGEGQTAVTIEVRPMSTIRGRVLRSGTAVAGAQVGCPNAPVFTDHDGAYRCTGVGEGPIDVYANLPSGEWGRGSVTIVNGTSAQLDIPISFNGVICGRTVDEQGAAVAGLVIEVVERTTGDYGKDSSAADGSFCARLLSGGTYNVTVRTAVGGVIAPLVPVPPVSLGPTETAHVTISVPAPRLAISGTVRDPDGAPVVDAIVRTAPASLVGTPDFAALTGGRLWVTDENGRFTLSGLAAGDYLVSVTGRDGSAVRKSGVAAGTSDLVITLAGAGALDGTLVGFTSPPRITVVMITNDVIDIGQPFMVEAVVEGTRFHASGLSPGTYVLTALTDAREGNAQKIVVRPGAPTPVTMTSYGTATLIGTVRDFATRAPIAGIRCAPFPRTSDAVGTIFDGPDQGVATDVKGTFRMTTSAGDINILCIGGGTLNRAAARNITVKRDDTTTVELFSVMPTPNPGTIDVNIDWVQPRLTTVAKGGTADQAGLVAGDLIIAVDGVSVDELANGSIMQLITQRPAGTKAVLTIVRGTERRTIAVTVRSAS
jgi:RNA polymerase sigma factor (sigma-70 family)